MRNQDFQLCAGGGLADAVRTFVKGYRPETVKQIADAFTKILYGGKMPFLPAVAGLFAEVWNTTATHEQNCRNIEIARDTLNSIIAGN